LGVKKYDCYVSDGNVIYFGMNNESVESMTKYKELAVSEKSDVEKWQVNTDTMTCTYFDRKDQEMVVEKIPAV
jgi:uncharacterized protein YbcV (DUF1398 family)